MMRRMLWSIVAAACIAASPRSDRPAPQDLLSRVDVSDPRWGTRTYGTPKHEVFEARDGTVLLVYQSRYGGDGDHTENRLKLFRFGSHGPNRVLDLNIDFTRFVVSDGFLTGISGQHVESLCQVCDGWEVSEEEDIFLIPITIRLDPVKVHVDMNESERDALMVRLKRRVEARNAQASRQGDGSYPAFSAAVLARIRALLVRR